jgi:hypothetical protein
MVHVGKDCDYLTHGKAYAVSETELSGGEIVIQSVSPYGDRPMKWYEEKNTRDPHEKWKRGDTIVCVDGKGLSYKGEIPGHNTITEGKQYAIQEMVERLDNKGKSRIYVIIVSDRGKMDQFMAKRFKTISEIREEKLKELGI